MDLSLVSFRLWVKFKHTFTSWNTGGGGIHSPYLFDLVRHVLHDNHRYYSWQDIEKLRSQLLRDPRVLEVEDYGVGKWRPARRTICQIARTSLESPRCAQLLFRLLNYLHVHQSRPLNVVELGTNLGITTAYLAAVDRQNQIWTHDGSSQLIEVAKQNWQQLKLGADIHAVLGNIDETLPLTINNVREHARDARALPVVDMAFLDANHTYDATMRYWKLLEPLHADRSIYVLDDIHYSQEMEQAWREIQQRPEVTTTMDLYHMGLVFFDPQYIKRHYKLRF